MRRSFIRYKYIYLIAFINQEYLNYYQLDERK